MDILLPTEDEIEREGWNTPASEYWKEQVSERDGLIAALRDDLIWLINVARGADNRREINLGFEGEDRLNEIERRGQSEFTSIAQAHDAEVRRKALIHGSEMVEARIPECKHERLADEETDDLATSVNEQTKQLNGCSRCWEDREIAVELRALAEREDR
jgi:hypothetical protein